MESALTYFLSSMWSLPLKIHAFYPELHIFFSSHGDSSLKEISDAKDSSLKTKITFYSS